MSWCYFSKIVKPPTQIINQFRRYTLCFTVDNITVKRPGNGISPMEWDNIIGKGAKKDFKEDEMIEL